MSWEQVLIIIYKAMVNFLSDFWKFILTTGSIAGLFSISWQIYVYKKEKNKEKSKAEMELIKASINKCRVEEEIDNLKRKINYYHVNSECYYDTDSEKLNNLQNNLDILEEEKNNKIRGIEAEEIYYKKILGQ